MSGPAASQEGFTSYVLLSCAQDNGRDFLEAALVAGIVKAGNKLLVPCYDLDPRVLDKFRFSGAELSVLRLAGSSQTEPLLSSLLLDLLTALTAGLLSLSLEGYRMTASPLSCADSKAWQPGLALVEKIRSHKFIGQSGTVSLDQDGWRRNFSVSVMEVTRKGLVTGAVWSSNNGYLKYSGLPGSACSLLTSSCLLLQSPSQPRPALGSSALSRDLWRS